MLVEKVGWIFPKTETIVRWYEIHSDFGGIIVVYHKNINDFQFPILKVKLKLYYIIKKRKTEAFHRHSCQVDCPSKFGTWDL